jgi:hypothetical protein
MNYFLHLFSACDQGICATEHKDVFLIASDDGIDRFRLTLDRAFEPIEGASFKLEALTEVQAHDLYQCSGAFDLIAKSMQVLDSVLSVNDAEFYGDLFTDENPSYPMLMLTPQ